MKGEDIDRIARNLETFLYCNRIAGVTGFDMPLDILADVMIGSALVFGLRLRGAAGGGAREGERGEPGLVDLMDTARNRGKKRWRQDEED
jgi:hypothetical protein